MMMPASNLRLPKITLVLVGLGLLAGCKDDPPASNGGSTTGADTDATTTPDPVTGDETGQQVGEPPPTPEIISPADGATDVGELAPDGVTIASELCWKEVADPEGNRVRYRIFLDDIELTEGKLAEEIGFEGSCLPLNFNPDQSYTWQVQAFEADFLDADGNPTSQSGKSAPATFTTRNLGSTVVFEDDFEGEDKGWGIGGDANGGDWVYGTPEETITDAKVSQPAMCAGGTGCWFTGHNPDGLNNIADVRGGTTTLTSPPFDLSGWEAASVRLDRFFFKQVFPETGTMFRVELVIPDDASPTGEQVFVLEQLESDEDAAASNTWTPMEYAACGLPMVAGSRVRLVATDLGQGILEAAVDNVEVVAYSDTKLCDGGAGALCDPKNADACGNGLECCNQGVVNNNVYRCEIPVADLAYPGGGVGKLGCNAPDLFPTQMGMTWQEDDIFVSQNSCLLAEQCVGGPGSRKLLRFDTITPNMGSRDLIMGVPTNHPDLFHFSECHGHYHFDGYAVYDLLDADDNVVAEGHKQAFCLLDWQPWTNVAGGGYNCSNQGISAGWEDVYGGYLDCNWIDITDVPNGTYTLRISVNPALAETGQPPIIERDYSNNVLEVPVTITQN